MKIRNSVYDIVINICCLLMLVGVTIFLVVSWKNIPAEIPMHYNFAGEIDRWGLKSEMIFLPIISWVMYILITVIERFPNVWNTGIKITEENKEPAYRILKKLISTVKLIIVAMFSFLSLQTALSFKLPFWFLPVYIVILFGDIFFWIWKLIRIR